MYVDTTAVAKRTVTNNNILCSLLSSIHPTDIQSIYVSSISTFNDYRCGICLQFNKNVDDFRAHIMRSHPNQIICENCQDIFVNLQNFDNHLGKNEFNAKKCQLARNSKRKFICKINVPKTYPNVFCCPNCSKFFSLQHRYIQHALEHVSLFTCAQCPTKYLQIDLMREHIGHHS